MQCPKCRSEVDDQASVCPYCRAKLKAGLGTYLGVGFVILLVIGAVSKNDNSASSFENVQSGTVNEAALSDIIDKHPWNYDKEPDGISGKPIISAETTSTNSVNFAAPYDGGSVLSIYLRKHPRSGVSAIVSITKGQMVCDVSDGCTVVATFDGGKPRRFHAQEPSDYTSTALFVTPTSSFISALRSSKTATLEVEFYQEGSQQFTFATHDLHWPVKPSDL